LLTLTYQFKLLFKCISVAKHQISFLGVPILILCKILNSLIVSYIISTIGRLSSSQISVCLPWLHHTASHHIVLCLFTTIYIFVVSRSRFVRWLISVKPFDYVDNLRLIKRQFLVENHLIGHFGKINLGLLIN